MSNYQHERGWLDSDVWENAPYSEREAWSWMIGEANWKDTHKSIGGYPVMLLRGQFSSSLRFMAVKFQWQKNRVDRYLKKLCAWGMIKIGTANRTGQNIITICNYNKYQTKNGKSGTANGTQNELEWDSNGTATGQTRNPSNPSNQSNQLYIGDFDDFWAGWIPFEMTRGSKSKAEESYKKALNATNHENLIKKRDLYLAQCSKNKQKTKHVVTWLNQKGWQDDYTEIQQPKKPWSPF